MSELQAQVVEILDKEGGVMEYLHVRSLEDYHPGYKDRTLQWAKIYFKMVQGDPDCELIEDEIDWGRFIKFILLELQAQKPLPITDKYFKKKGFDLKKRPIELTLKMLHNFITILDEDLKERHVEEEVQIKNKIKNKIKIKAEIDAFSITLQNSWNKFVAAYPTLSQVLKISAERRNKIKSRYANTHFRENWEKVLALIPKYRFLLGDNKRSWKVSFDWLVENDTNYLKIIEGKYKSANYDPLA